VIVGINLLREGLDLPEVSLVAILDADKQGFLRSAVALIQTIGRAARNVHGKVIMYADVMTQAINTAINETNRRRTKQEAYNYEHHIEPLSIVREIHDITARLSEKAVAEAHGQYQSDGGITRLPKDEIQRLIEDTEKKMKQAARDLEFERAVVLRDQLLELRRLLIEDANIPGWKKAVLLAGEEVSPENLE
jgi:excinuclease ABC subunit B